MNFQVKLKPLKQLKIINRYTNAVYVYALKSCLLHDLQNAKNCQSQSLGQLAYCENRWVVIHLFLSFHYVYVKVLVKSQLKHNYQLCSTRSSIEIECKAINKRQFIIFIEQGIIHLHCLWNNVTLAVQFLSLLTLSFLV